MSVLISVIHSHLVSWMGKTPSSLSPSRVRIACSCIYEREMVVGGGGIAIIRCDAASLWPRERTSTCVVVFCDAGTDANEISIKRFFFFVFVPSVAVGLVAWALVK